MSRIGIAGMGRMGERVAIAARNMGHEVSRAFDLSSDAYAFKDEKLKSVATSDLDSFLSSDLDLIAIATNGPSHCPLVKKSLSSGHKRILVEKPVCTSMSEGEALMELVNAEDARVIVNHGRRYCSVYDNLSRLDAAPETGELAAAVLTMGAAGLGCMGTHFFDLFIRVMGRPTHVFGQLSPFIAKNPRGDEYEDPGVTGIIGFGDKRVLVEMCDDIGVPARMEFIYRHGRVVIENELSPWKIMTRPVDARDASVTRYGIPLEENVITPFHGCEIIFATSGAIADALGDEEPICDLRHGLEAFEVFAALRWSAKINEVVRLPLTEEAKKQSYAIS